MSETTSLPPTRPEGATEGPTDTGPGPPALPAEGFPVLAGYQILRELGRGGMGVVYEAREVRLDRLVALKVVRASTIDADELARFMAEARALAGLRHPHVVSIHAVSEPGQPPFFTMEWMAGGNLAQKLDGTPWPGHKAAELVETLARAMHFVHLRHLVHRDLKPANVLLTTEGLPKIADFGLARRLDNDRSLFASGVIVGTPSYMAPEQALGSLAGQIGPAADIYSLGAILYELLTGRPPFRKATPMDTVLQLLQEGPVPPRRINAQVPKALETVCLKCLERRPHRRYADALALADDLRNFLDHKPIRARSVGWIERALLWALRQPTRAAVYGLSALVVLLMTLAVLANLVGTREIDAAGQRLTSRVQQGDRAMARLIAQVVQKNLHDRIEFLEGFRNEHAPTLRVVSNGREGDPVLSNLLDTLSSQGKPRSFFSQYAIADRTGHVLAGNLEPSDPANNCAYRDWFNGQGDQHGRESQSFPPVRDTYISQPYLSKAVNHPGLSVNVTVPLFDGKKSDPIGVLTGRIAIHDLHFWLAGVDIRDGFAVLLNERGQCLLHKELDRIVPPHGEDPIDWRSSCPLYRQALSDDPGDGVAQYEDPIENEEYFAGYAPFHQRSERHVAIHWLAIVQHDRAAVLRPMNELKAERRARMLWGLLIGGGLLVGLWSWLFLTGDRRRQGGLQVSHSALPADIPAAPG